MRRLAAGALLALSLGLTGCPVSSDPTTSSSQHPNVVWISLDGARPSFLTTRDSSPGGGPLASLRGRAVYFDRVISASDQQPYAQACALTSRQASQVAPLLPEHFRFDADLIRLPRVLGFYGYKTAAFWADAQAPKNHARDYDFGSNHYEAHCGGLLHQAEAASAWLASARATPGPEGPNAPCFVYIQALDCVGAGDARTALRSTHHSGISLEASCHQDLGNLLQALETQGLNGKNTLFVLNAPFSEVANDTKTAGTPSPDGEARATWLQRVHVPLAVWGAGVPSQLQGRHIDTLCSTLDLVPTVLNLTHIVVPAQSEGVALLGEGSSADPAGRLSSAASKPESGKGVGARSVVITEGETWVAGITTSGQAWQLAGMPAGSPRLLAALKAAQSPAVPTPPTWGQVVWPSPFPNQLSPNQLSPSAATLSAVASADPAAFALLHGCIMAVERKSRVNEAAARKTTLDPALREALRRKGYW